MEKDVLKVLAEQIAAVGVLMRGGEFAVCVSSKDVSKEDVKQFNEFLEESITCSRKALRGSQTERT